MHGVDLTVEVFSNDLFLLQRVGTSQSLQQVLGTLLSSLSWLLLKRISQLMHSIRASSIPINAQHVSAVFRLMHSIYASSILINAQHICQQYSN